MAIIHYNPIDSDFLKIKFRCCKCGAAQTELVSPELPSAEESCFSKVQSQCGCMYDVYCKDKLIDAYIDIIDLPTENVLSKHSIWWEHYLNFDTEYLDVLEENHVLEESIEESSSLPEPCKTYVYGALWCRIISMLDVYCHYTIQRQILSDDGTWESFASAIGKHEEGKEWSRKDMKDLLKHTSFQSLDNLSSIFHHVFGFDIDTIEKEKLKEAVFVRNKLIHHQGRGADGERYVVTKEMLITLREIVCSFISNIEKIIKDYDINKKVQKAMDYNKQQETKL